MAIFVAIILVGFSVIHYSSSVDQDALQLSDMILNNQGLGTINEMSYYYQQPGRYKSIAQKTEKIARAMAKAYITESRKRLDEYITAYKKYKNEQERYNEIVKKRGAIKVIEFKNWAKV